MKGLRDVSIGGKLIMIALAVGVVQLLVMAAAVVVYELREFRPRVERDVMALGEVIRTIIPSRFTFEDAKTATRDLNSLRARSEVHAACLYAADGSVFARYARTESSFSCPPPPAEPVSGKPEFHDRHVDLVMPVDLEGRVLGHLYLRYELRPLAVRLPPYGIMVGVVLLGIVGGSILLSLSFRHLISGPITALAAAAREVSERQDYGVRVDRRGSDELGELTAAFNQMLATVEQRDGALRRAGSEQEVLQEQLVQAQKMESIGRLAGGVAHDFNNLLTVIAGCTEMVQKELVPESPLQGQLENVRHAAAQAAELTSKLLVFARRQVSTPQVINLSSLLVDAERMLRSLIGDHIELAMIPRPDLWSVKADPNQMLQVLMNLGANARDAMPQGGTLTIETRNTVLGEEYPGVPAGEYVLLQVSDTGEGLTEEVKANLFEPFFTTKDAGQGTGLGLATCYGIVRQSGGHIWVDSEPGQGTRFKIFLRRTTESPAAPTVVGEVSKALPQGKETILVVEDSALVRATTVQLLRAQGYTLLEAAGGPDAIRLAADYDGVIDLLVADVVMPEMSGKEAAQKLQAARPGLKVLFMSGYTPDVVVEYGVLRGGTAFLQKPCTAENLARKVRAVLDE